METKLSKKQAILECAKKLIAQKGVAKTSTNDIVKELGIARGTFYHYFPSKEAMIDDLFEEINDELFDQARKIAQDSSIPPLERILLTLQVLNLESQVGQNIIDHLHESENALLHIKVQTALFKELPTIFCTIIEDGIKEGLFTTPFPLETMELVILYINTAFDMDQKMDPEIEFKKVLALKHNLILLLGAKEEDIDYLFKKIMENTNYD